MLEWSPNTPSHSRVKQQFSCHGFRFGSARHTEASLFNVPHDVSKIGELAGLGLPTELVECAEACLVMFPAPIASTEISSLTVDASANWRVGPKQWLFLEFLASKGFNATVLSAYRSPIYQALLFSAKYLDGTLFDSDGRYFCLPPQFSDHVNVDAAIDIENSNGLVFAISSIDESLPCSVFRPFLSHRNVAFEPWHWRTLFISSISRSVPTSEHRFPRVTAQTSTAAVREYFDSQYRRPDDISEIRPTAHVFSHGYNWSGQNQCVGSLRQTIPLSISDASLAAGAWPHRIVTIPHGFTPLMDGTILPWDVGACIFRLISNDAQAPTYLTPSTCVAEAINIPEKIVTGLETKAQLDAGKVYFLEKSLADEWLNFNDAVTLPIEYGNPRSGFYRFVDAPILLINRFEAWLISSDRGDVPPYIIYPPEFSPIFEFNSVHYALLLSYLSEFCLDDQRFSDLYASLNGLVSKSVLESKYRSECSVDAQILATAVFQIRSLIFYSEKNAMQTFDFWWPHLKNYIDNHIAEEASRLLFGHISCVLRMLIDKNLIDKSRCSILPSSSAALGWLKEGLIYSLAAAQVIALHMSIDPALNAPLGFELMAKIVRWPSGIGLGEFGSFDGLETFQSSLPIEAARELWPLVELDVDERQGVIRRSTQAIGFLARCQFDEGTGLLSSRQENLIGAVPYSLLDKHVRVDYGVHASRAARFVAENIHLLDPQ